MKLTLPLTILFASYLTLSAREAVAEDEIEIEFTTTPTSSPRYAPRNIVAVWVEDANGRFVRTLLRYAQRRVANLRAWTAVAEDSSLINSMPDVITGATRTSHGVLHASWNLTDYQGRLVPPGSYTIRMELTDHDTSTSGGNNQGSFSFENDGQAVDQMGLSNGGFQNVSVTYSGGSTIPGVDDPNKVCELVAQCIDDDGCCLPDCVYEVDNDCDPTSARDDAAGGCAIAGNSRPYSLLFVAGVFVLLGLGRRRR